MGKIYTSMEDFEKAQEEEFRAKVIEVNSYYGSSARTTIDGEWEHEELKDDLWSVAHEYLHGKNGSKGWLETHKGRALYDEDLTHEQFIVEKICSTYDLIEVYNRAYDKHRNDKPMKFGIHYFDELALAEVKKILKGNLVTGE